MATESAVVVADSEGPASRLTTLLLRYPRFIHSEVLTHRSHSRNSASSRAVPTGVRLSLGDYCPETFGRRAAGMGDGGPLPPARNWLARRVWTGMAAVNRAGAWTLARLGVAKQWANRPLEWCGYIEVVATADEWGWANFLAQRCHPAAQPEMRRLAEAVRDAIGDSVPRACSAGDWHLPFDPGPDLPLRARAECSVGRCAGVSYLDTAKDVFKAVALARRLAGERPPHWSPFEHAAVCRWGRHDNFTGWASLRFLTEKLKQDPFRESA